MNDINFYELKIAVKEGNISRLRGLCEVYKNFDINYKDWRIWTLLHYA